MVGMAQLVSAPDCGSGGQGFNPLPLNVLEKSYKFSIHDKNDNCFVGYRQAVGLDFDSWSVVQIHLAQLANFKP